MQASEFFEIVRVTLKKFHKNLLFPSVACSSYFGYFVQFSRCGSDLFRNQIQTLSIPKCLNPISTPVTIYKPEDLYCRQSKFSLPTFFFKRKLVGPSGLEPPTSRLSVVRSSQLSYGPIGGDKRVRTVDPLLAKQVLSQLSYTPIHLQGVRPLN